MTSRGVSLSKESIDPKLILNISSQDEKSLTQGEKDKDKEPFTNEKEVEVVAETQLGPRMHEPMHMQDPCTSNSKNALGLEIKAPACAKNSQPWWGQEPTVSS